MVLLGFVLLNHSEIADKISNHITPGNPISLLLIKRNTSDSLVTNQKPQSIATEQIRFWEHKPKQWIIIHMKLSQYWTEVGNFLGTGFLLNLD